jgi:hypothetical protein
MDNVQLYNEIVKKWRAKVMRSLKSAASHFSEGKTESMVKRGQITGFVRNEKKLADSIGSKIRNVGALPDTITFTFERHGIFVDRGVGRGHSKSKPRGAKAWINPAVATHVPELADKIAEADANALIKFKT